MCCTVTSGVLSRAELTVEGTEPEAIAGGVDAGSTARFCAVVRSLDERGADPTVRVDRLREVRPEVGADLDTGYQLRAPPRTGR